MFRIVFKHAGTRYEREGDAGVLADMKNQFPKAPSVVTPASTVLGGAGSSTGLSHAPGVNPQGALAAWAPSPEDASPHRPPQGAKRRPRKRKGKSKEEKSAVHALRNSQPLVGNIYWMRQAHVEFGKNANINRDTRGVMHVIDRLGPTQPVMPIFSVAHEQNRPDIYAIPNEVIDFADMWGLQNGLYSNKLKPYRYLKRNFEAVQRNDFGRMWGRIIEFELLKIRHWIIGKNAS